jgi:hypothetical protein
MSTHEEPVRKPPPHPAHTRIVFLLAATIASIDELANALDGHVCRPDSYGNCHDCELRDDIVHLKWVLDYGHSMIEGQLIPCRQFDALLVARDQGILASLDGLLDGSLRIASADAEAISATVAETAETAAAAVENPFYRPAR